jgi:hypothetical protein
VAQFVMDYLEVFRRDLDAHLDAQVVLEIDVPGAGVAHHIAVRGFGKQRPFPESIRQRGET